MEIMNGRWYIGNLRSSAIAIADDKSAVLAEIELLPEIRWRAYHPIGSLIGHPDQVMSVGLAESSLDAAKAVNQQFERWGFEPLDLSPFEGMPEDA